MPVRHVNSNRNTSEQEKGSTFTLQLPLNHTQEPPAEEPVEEGAMGQ